MKCYLLRGLITTNCKVPGEYFSIQRDCLDNITIFHVTKWAESELSQGSKGIRQWPIN